VIDIHATYSDTFEDNRIQAPNAEAAALIVAGLLQHPRMHEITIRNEPDPATAMTFRYRTNQEPPDPDDLIPF
jgi:hypothetical protein